jgi:hypothetical protein
LISAIRKCVRYCSDHFDENYENINFTMKIVYAQLLQIHYILEDFMQEAKETHYRNENHDAIIILT